MISRTERGYRLEWVLLGLVLLSIASFLGYSLFRERAQIEALEGERLQNQARVIEQNLARQLDGVANALAGILVDFPRRNAGAAWSVAKSPRLKVLKG